MRTILALAFAAGAAVFLARESRGRPFTRGTLPHGEGQARVDLNAADADELAVLPGVGPATAETIAADRAANGPFVSPEDLRRVKGIGPAKYKRMEPWIEAR